MKKALIGTTTIALTLLLAGCGSQKANSQNNNKVNNVALANTDKDNSNNLSKLNYQSGKDAFVYVNNNKANLKASDWKYNHVVYSNLDSLNRTSTGNIAFLEGKNVANDSLRQTQQVKPTGWHQKFVNNEAILNRGHEIAYSLSKGIGINGKYNPKLQSGDQNNMKNLFTQTAFSNQKVQTIYESKVRNALKQGKKVIYMVTPVFKGNELMARGVHMQALSTDGSLNFNVYLYNVQPNIQFNYANGTSKVDNNMKVPTPADAPSFNNDHHNGNAYNNGYHYHKHHWVRDAVIAGTAHHFIKRHYEKKYAKYNYHHSYKRHLF